MQYQISRNGQTYGPYTLDDLHRYVASGNVLGTDLAKSDEMADWLPVSQLLATSAAPLGAAMQTSTPYTSVGAPLAASPVLANSAYPPPPNLHWALVLVISIFCSIFLFVWIIVQGLWMRQIEPKSQAIVFYAGAIGSLVLAVGLSAAVHNSFLTFLLFVAYLVLLIVGHFSMKASLEQHYNNVEPIGLTLSPVMTFFFNTIYFQYHFNRINEARKGGQYAAPRSL